MRIDGFSSQSYPIKRKPRKANATVDDAVEDSPDFIEVQADAQANAQARISGLPARQQDMIYHRTMKKSVAMALASYLSTAGFVDWDADVLGLDLYI